MAEEEVEEVEEDVVEGFLVLFDVVEEVEEEALVVFKEAF